MGLNLSSKNGDIIVRQVGTAPVSVTGAYVNGGTYNGSGDQNNGNSAGLVTGLLGGVLGGLL